MLLNPVFNICAAVISSSDRSCDFLSYDLVVLRRVSYSSLKYPFKLPLSRYYLKSSIYFLLIFSFHHIFFQKKKFKFAILSKYLIKNLLFSYYGSLVFCSKDLNWAFLKSLNYLDNK